VILAPAWQAANGMARELGWIVWGALPPEISCYPRNFRSPTVPTHNRASYFSVASDHSPADVAAGGCSYAATIDVVHTRAACVADLRDHAVRLMKRRNGHGLYRCREGQGKGNSDQPDHFFLLFNATVG